MQKHRVYISNKTLAYNGALIAVAAVFTYSILIMAYVIIRSSTTIYSIMSLGERNTILWANGISVAYSVAVFSLLMSAVSSMAGAAAAVVLKKVLLYFNPLFNLAKSIFISGIAALLMLSIVYLLLYAMLKDYMTFRYTETLLFWFLIPAILFFIVCMIAGGRLNKVLHNG